MQATFLARAARHPREIVLPGRAHRRPHLFSAACRQAIEGSEAPRPSDKKPVTLSRTEAAFPRSPKTAIAEVTADPVALGGLRADPALGATLTLSADTSRRHNRLLMTACS